MAELEPGERSPGRGIGVRRALAGEIGRKEEPFGAGPPWLGLCDEVGEGRVRRQPVAEPLQRSRRGEHHAHRVPLVGHRVAERVHARLRIGRERRQRGKDDAGGSQHDRERPRAVDPDSDGGGRAVARPGRNRNPL